MRKAIIVYKGKYGATQQYAQWLGEETGFPVVAADQSDADEVDQSQMVIIGTSVYIGKLQIRKWLIENLPILKNKKLHLFVVAGTPPDQVNKLMPYVRNSVPNEIIEKMTITFLPGRLIFRKLGWWDKFLLKMGAKMTKDKNEAKGMLTDHDDVKKENLDRLISQFKK